jgi:hypothetical protein
VVDATLRVLDAAGAPESLRPCRGLSTLNTSTTMRGDRGLCPGER